MKYKIIGVINIAYAFLGLLSIGFSIIPTVRYFETRTVDPGVITAFWIMTLINTLFIVLLVISGAKLYRKNGSGITIASATYIVETTYFVCVGFLWLSPFGDAIAGATGGGNMGIAPQVITLFPIIALLVLNVPFKRKEIKSPADVLVDNQCV